MDDQFLELINRIVNENLANEHFSVEELAEKAGMSRSMLHRKLVRLTGKSASAYITEIRLNRAKEFLENNVATVSEIAYKVGFNSVSYFHRVFKKRFKVSPGDIKKNVVSGQYQEAKEQYSHKSNFSRFKLWTFLFLLIIIIAGGLLYYVFSEKRTSEKSIAILPFDNLSSDEKNQYFADGIVEDLINRLSRLEDLKVISRTSSEMFRDKGNNTVPEIGKILGVNYILEGSVQRETDNVRINIQLIDARNDDHIFSEQYDKELREVFRIQGEIASQIVDELAVFLSENQLKEIKKAYTSDLKAFDYYQIGNLKYCFCTRDNVLSSIDYFKKAIEADSNYAMPYAQMATAYWYLVRLKEIVDIQNGRDTAVMFALKAVEIDENLAEAHAALGTIYLEADLNIKAAENEFRNAIELNPNSSEAYKEYAEFLSVTGKPEKAREYMNKAIVLDPLRFNVRHVSTLLYMREKNYQKALEENLICLEIKKDHPIALDRLFSIHLKLGNEKAAYESFQYQAKILGKLSSEDYDSIYNTMGIEGIIRLQISQHESYLKKAKGHIELEEYEKAIEMLEIALAQKQLLPFDLYLIAHFNPNLETYPEFIILKNKIGLK